MRVDQLNNIKYELPLLNNGVLFSQIANKEKTEYSMCFVSPYEEYQMTKF